MPKISNLNPLNVAITGSELIPLSKGDETYKSSLSSFSAYLSSTYASNTNTVELTAAPSDGPGVDAYATGHFIIETGIVENEFVSIGDTSFFFKESLAAPGDILIAGSTNETATNAANAVLETFASTIVYAEAVNNVVSLTAIAIGVAGNEITLATDSAFVTVSGPVLSGGSSAPTNGTFGQIGVVNNTTVYICTRTSPVKWVQLG